MHKNRGELATILTIATLVLLGVMTTLSATVLKNKKLSSKSRAAEGQCTEGITNVTLKSENTSGDSITGNSVIGLVVTDNVDRPDRRYIFAGKINNDPWFMISCPKINDESGPNAQIWNESNGQKHAETSFRCSLNNVQVGNRIEFGAARIDESSSAAPCGGERIWDPGKYAKVATPYIVRDLGGGGAPAATSTPVPQTATSTPAPGITTTPTAVPTATAIIWDIPECNGDAPCICRKNNADLCSPIGGNCERNKWDTKWGCRTKGGANPQITQPAADRATQAPGTGTISSSNSEACMKCVFDKDNNLARLGLFMCKDNNGNKQWFTSSQGCKDQFNNWCNSVDPNGCKTKKTECLAACSDTPAPTTRPATGVAGTTGATSSTPTATPTPGQRVANPGQECKDCKGQLLVEIKSIKFGNLFSNSVLGYDHIFPRYTASFQRNLPSDGGFETATCTLGYSPRKYYSFNTRDSDIVIKVDDTCSKQPVLTCKIEYFGVQAKRGEGGFHDPVPLKVKDLSSTTFSCRPTISSNIPNTINEIEFEDISSIPTTTPRPGATGTPVSTTIPSPIATRVPIATTTTQPTSVPVYTTGTSCLQFTNKSSFKLRLNGSHNIKDLNLEIGSNNENNLTCVEYTCIAPLFINKWFHLGIEKQNSSGMWEQSSGKLYGYPQQCDGKVALNNYDLY